MKLDETNISLLISDMNLTLRMCDEAELNSREVKLIKVFCTALNLVEEN